MGKVGYTASPEAAEERYEEVYNHKKRCPYRDYPENVDQGIGIEDGEHDEKSVDRTWGSHKNDVRIGKVVDSIAGQSWEETDGEVVQQELLWAQTVFNGSSEDVQCQHVEDEMTYSRVGEHVGKELPVIMFVVYVGRNEAEVVLKSREQESREGEYREVDNYQRDGKVWIGVSEFSV